jgi:hypothetical protein
VTHRQGETPGTPAARVSPRRESGALEKERIFGWVLGSDLGDTSKVEEEEAMKKHAQSSKGRILGRRLARELPNQELGRSAGSSAIGVWTYTLLYPSDPGGPSWDSSGGGGTILV